jgi:hypothetical protein
LDKINDDIDLGTQKQMVKVLDAAIEGSPVKKNIAKKAAANGIFVFLIYTLFIFFKEYFSQLKKSKSKR